MNQDMQPIFTNIKPPVNSAKTNLIIVSIILILTTGLPVFVLSQNKPGMATSGLPFLFFDMVAAIASSVPISKSIKYYKNSKPINKKELWLNRLAAVICVLIALKWMIFALIAMIISLILYQPPTFG